MINKYLYSLIIIAAIFASCGNGSKEKAADSGNDSTSTPVDTTLTKTDQAVELDTADVSFLQNAAYGGLTEVESSNKIVQFTKDGDVKSFAQMMVKDHSEANIKLKALAAQKGYRLPANLPNTRLQLIDKLATLKNDGKDEYYINLMMIEHRNAINLFSLASKSKDQDISKFSSGLLPTLRHHYQHTLRIDTLLHSAKANQGDDPIKLSDRKQK